MFGTVVALLLVVLAFIFRETVSNVVQKILLALHSFADEYNSAYIDDDGGHSTSGSADFSTMKKC